MELSFLSQWLGDHSRVLGPCPALPPTTPQWNLRVNLFYIRDNYCQILDQSVRRRQLFIIQKPQAFSQPAFLKTLQRCLKDNRLKPLPPCLKLPWLLPPSSLFWGLGGGGGWEGGGSCWGRGHCSAVLEPVAHDGMGQPKCSSCPSLQSMTSPCQLEIGHGDSIYTMEIRTLLQMKTFLPPGGQVVKYLLANPWAQVFPGQFPCKGCEWYHWGLYFKVFRELYFKVSKEDSRSLRY